MDVLSCVELYGESQNVKKLQFLRKEITEKINCKEIHMKYEEEGSSIFLPFRTHKILIFFTAVIHHSIANHS